LAERCSFLSKVWIWWFTTWANGLRKERRKGGVGV
jgi:hypothetical protein